MLKHVDSVLENDKLAGIAAGLLGIATWVLIGVDLIPEPHTEAAGSMATMAVAFAMAALRRNSVAATRREAADAEYAPPLAWAQDAGPTPRSRHEAPGAG